MTDKPITGYMCLTDWLHELGEASDGTEVYPSKKALEQERPCVKECGIAKVEVRLVKVVRKSRL